MLSCSVSIQQRGDAEAWLRKLIAATRGPSTVAMGLVPGQIAGDVLSYGWYNHEGTSRGIPSRPFVRIGFHRAEGGFRVSLRGTLRGILHGQVTYASALPRFGQQGVKAVQAAIDSGIRPANAASTVAKKGHGMTLRHTYALRGSVSFKVR